MPDLAILAFEDGVGLGPGLSGVLAAAPGQEGAVSAEAFHSHGYT